MKNKLIFLVSVLLFTCCVYKLQGQNKTTYKYDAMNRIKEVRFQNGTVETYTYDKVGNRISMYKVVDTSGSGGGSGGDGGTGGGGGGGGSSSIQSDTALNVFKIFPNPTDGVFTISGKLVNIEPSTIIIYDLQGKEVLSLQLGTSNLVSQSIDISTLPSGSYQLMFISESKKQSWTVIKQ